MDRATLCALTQITLSQKESETIQKWVREIVEDHKPIAYIIGSVPFLNTTIKVKPPILIPRPETEWWCELLINGLRANKCEKFTFLDLCTGSGCIAIAVAKNFPKSTVWAVDIAKNAIELAKENAQAHGLTNCKFMQSDLFTELVYDTSFDIITANPPYVSPEEYEALDLSVRNWESHDALFARNEGMEIIEKIIAQAPSRLTPTFVPMGRIWIECGAGQGTRLEKMVLPKPYTRKLITDDLAGRTRLIRLFC